MSYTEGFNGENHFMDVMDVNQISYSFINKWYDFRVNSHKVEVKTCKLVISNGHKHIGMYEFTKKYNRQKQYDENVWICLLIEHQGQFMFQGFVRAKELNMKQHISIVAASKLNLLNISDFLVEMRK